jgi:cysteine synthase A
MVVAIDDNAVVNLARLFNEPVGREFLVKQGVAEDFVNQLDLLGFSGISNVLSSIKFAKYYELGRNDVVLTVLTDSMELYDSRLHEMREEFGAYSEIDAAAHFARYLQGVTTDHLLELSYVDRRRIHNLKYFTWIEQQGKTYEEIMAQWYDRDYWTELQAQIPQIDALIEEFNQEVGLI